MSGQSNSEGSRRRLGDSFLFIQHRPESQQATSSRIISSFARRWQSDRRRQDLRSSARQDAVYARSLVGWRAQTRERFPEIGSSAGVDRKPASSASQPMTVTVLQPTSGLRVDPFNSLPVEQDRDVMYVTDYFIHIWAHQKATHFDTLIGQNTHLTLCWPVALQDDMFFDATMACSRAAWCLTQRTLPESDHFHLQHRGMAMSKLRQRLSQVQSTINKNVLFTMDYMLNISYMTKDDAAFKIHLTAFKNVANSYLSARVEVNDEISSVISHRLRSWEALDGYRNGVDVFRQRLQSDSSQEVAKLTHIYDTLSWQQCQMLAGAAPGFVELVHLGLISLELAAAAVQTGHLLDLIQEGPDKRGTAHVTTQLSKILSSDRLSDVELQLGYALLALCFYLDRTIQQASQGRNTESSVDASLPMTENATQQADLPLKAVAQAYINRKLTRCVHDSPVGHHCAMWSSLVLGSVLLQLERRGLVENEPLSQNDLFEHGLKSKGHIILVATGQALASSASVQPDDTSWPTQLLPEPVFEFLARHFLGTPALCALWAQSWQAAMRRQRDWEEHGQLLVGKPVTIPEDDEETKASIEIEYMVLRDGRESLPPIIGSLDAEAMGQRPGQVALPSQRR
ncbi:hypothetical protein LTR72_004984 [Exophiala xenobiotica]|nr:hypothetical protein LTR72_004984 [Exophiala xenobiotica]KAK5286668.1 hypothetical protein LTR14_009735 [Exophiala xenobiotica]KAK5499893.1 hypothetical protein LTR55_000716 [Exophiala xenobiotica]